MNHSSALKTSVALLALLAVTLTVPTTPGHAQTRSATTGMGGAEAVLKARGDTRGADRIARARCLSGIGACTGKYAGYARATKNTARQEPMYGH